MKFITIRAKGTNQFLGKRDPTYGLYSRNLKESAGWLVAENAAWVATDEKVARRLLGRAAGGDKTVTFPLWEVVITEGKMVQVIPATEFYRNGRVK